MILNSKQKDDFIASLAPEIKRIAKEATVNEVNVDMDVLLSAVANALILSIDNNDAEDFEALYSLSRSRIYRAILKEVDGIESA